MNDKTHPKEKLDILIVEHGEIVDKIKEIIDWWSQLEEKGLPKYGEMAMYVNELRDLLATHYSEEENEYFVLIKKEFPEIDLEIRKMEIEHEKLLLKLDQFIAKLNLPGSGFQSWNEVMTDFQEFLKPFNEHEILETRIIQEALKRK